MKIDRAGYPFIAAAALPAAALALARRPALSASCAAVAGFLTYFFRDPERDVPQQPGAVVSPADGRVMIAGPGDSRWAPPGEWQQVTHLPVAHGRPHQPDAGRGPRDPHRVPAGEVPAGVRRRFERQRAERGLAGPWGPPGGVPSGRRHAGQADCVPGARGRHARARTARRADEVRVAHGRLPASRRGDARRSGAARGRRR